MAVVVAVLCLNGLVSHVPRRRLPDGTWLELRDWKYGTNPKLDERSGWWNLVPRGLVGTPLLYNPNPVRAVRENVLMLHLLVARTRKPGATAAVYGAITDAHGCWFEPEMTDRGVSRAGDFEILRFKQFPAGCGRLQLGFHDGDGSAPMATFGVSTPSESGSNVALEKAQRLPAAVAAGDRTFILSSLRHRDTGMHYREVAAFEVRRSGRIETGWEAYWIEVSDGSGASVRSGLMDRPLYSAPGEARFSGLCRRSPAWQIKVAFRRLDPKLGPYEQEATFVVKP